MGDTADVAAGGEGRNVAVADWMERMVDLNWGVRPPKKVLRVARI